MWGNSINLSTVISSFGVVAILAGWLYSLYRLKQKHQEKLTLLQEEINNRDLLLKKVISEKEWLLQEIHHRVKNNLQIVISLLNTQSAYLHNEDALDAIRKSQQRMYAISLIHQKLYQSDNLAEIDMKWYIKELVDYMKDCYGTGHRILFVLKSDNIRLDVAQAVPLGLILNEGITNAIKHAFPEDHKGMVEISFNHILDNNCKLRIKDNGIGLPLEFEAEARDSLGMNLINGLTEQLNGEIHMWNDDGLILEIIFKRHSGFGNIGNTNIPVKI